MRLLLDTHCWLWWHAEPDKLPSPVRRLLRLRSNTLLLSAACVYEIAVKAGSGRLQLAISPEAMVDVLLQDAVVPLPIDLHHAARAGALPPHHRDPFDRLLVAQAQLEALTLVTADPMVLKYDIRTIDARK